MSIPELYYSGIHAMIIRNDSDDKIIYDWIGEENPGRFFRMYDLWMAGNQDISDYVKHTCYVRAVNAYFAERNKQDAQPKTNQ